MTDRYQDGRYAAENPRWHGEDAPFKADAVLRTLDRVGWRPARIADVGCGTGDVLNALRKRLDATGRGDVTLVGWDPSPDVARLWRPHDRVTLREGDAITAGEHADVALALDVCEHLTDDVAFLEALHRVAARVILRMPLDDSRLDRWRPARLQAARDRLGHLHAYTRSLALERVARAGWQVVDTAYDRVPPPVDTPRRAMVDAARRLAMRLAPDVAADTLGGWSLLVAATA